jgi:hypothetical protein
MTGLRAGRDPEGVKGQRCTVEDCGSATVRESKHCSYHRATKVRQHLAEFEGFPISVATIALPRLSWNSIEPEECEALGRWIARSMGHPTAGPT